MCIIVISWAEICKLIMTIHCELFLEFQFCRLDPRWCLSSEDVKGWRAVSGQMLFYLCLAQICCLWGCAFLRVPCFMFLYLPWGNATVCGDSIEQDKIVKTENNRFSKTPFLKGWSMVVSCMYTSGWQMFKRCVKPAAATSCLTSEYAWKTCQ